MGTLQNKTITPGRKDSPLLDSPRPKLGDKKPEVFQCEIHGKQEVTVLFLNNDWMQPECPLCQQERRAAEKKREDDREKVRQAVAKQAAIESRFKRAGIPQRFKNHSLDTFIPATEEAQKVLKVCKDYASNFQQMKELGRCMIFSGTTGTGKTHLSCGIANHIIPKHMAAPLFISAFDMVRKVKQTYSRNSETTEEQAIRSFLHPDLLIIDEIGAQFGTDTEKMIIFEVINKRYEEVLPTILLSNLALTELANFVGERIVDRMKENGGSVCCFTWPSHRAKKVAS